MDERNFQVNMKGIIDLLSNHLYSKPQVFVRELLQNACDAIEARRHSDPKHVGEIEFETISAVAPNAPTLIVRDNGIGLDESEIHQFLATIGQSSKRKIQNREDFIGQFGIGLLSAFLVCEKIVVITRSVKPNSPTIQWIGKADGTYQISHLDQDFEPGTQVFVNAKNGCFDFFDREFINTSVTNYGKFLKHRIVVSCEDASEEINQPAPWTSLQRQELEQSDLLSFGKETLGTDFFDAIPVNLEELGVSGVIFVLPRANRSTRNRKHQIYLKDMFLTDSVENLLPEWAFFVTCVLNVNKLRPTAARESFYEDEQLAETRYEIGELLKRYLTELSQTYPERLKLLIALHYLSIKALAVEDDDFFDIVIDWLPFETNLGEMTLTDFRHSSDDTKIRFVVTVDQFRQVANVAAAQSKIIFNAGFTYDAELLDKLSDRLNDLTSEPIDPSDLLQDLEKLTPAEEQRLVTLLELANEVLSDFDCQADIRKFLPTDLPTLLTSNRDAEFIRSVEQARDESDTLFSGVLDSLSQQTDQQAKRLLWLNFSNGTIKRLAKIQNRDLLKRNIEILYVQSLLLGRFPINKKEMQLISTSILAMVDSSLEP